MTYTSDNMKGLAEFLLLRYCDYLYVFYTFII